jgi:enolase
VAKAAAASFGMPLYRYVGGVDAHLLPVPMMNVVNGGAHADNVLEIQEFMLVPLGAASYSEALQWGAETFHALHANLKAAGMSTGVGDEGGFAPEVATASEVLSLLTDAVRAAGLEPGSEVAFAIDVAASELYRDGVYRLEERDRSSKELIEFYAGLIDEFPIVSLEDPLAEDDWDGWVTLTEELDERVQLVGDDVFVTSAERLERGVDDGAANAILVKVNQVGSLTETLEVVRLAREASYGIVISHRSGETEDTTIADLAVAANAGQIKSGAPSRGERTAKYNRLLRIEEELGEAARYAGRGPYGRAPEFDDAEASSEDDVPGDQGDEA